MIEWEAKELEKERFKIIQRLGQLEAIILGDLERIIEQNTHISAHISDVVRCYEVPLKVLGLPIENMVFGLLECRKDLREMNPSYDRAKIELFKMVPREYRNNPPDLKALKKYLAKYQNRPTNEARGWNKIAADSDGKGVQHRVLRERMERLGEVMKVRGTIEEKTETLALKIRDIGEWVYIRRKEEYDEVEQCLRDNPKWTRDLIPIVLEYI